jgi:AcrR family transcriptional regulator
MLEGYLIMEHPTATATSALRRRTQRERRETSHRRMLDAAVKLIERQGSSRTTLAQIGEQSGYSYGLVSHRFGSKEALVRAVTHQLQSNFARHEMGEGDRLSGLNALTTVAQRYVRAAASRNRNALYVLIGEALGPVPEIRAEMAAADRNFRLAMRGFIEQGIEAREIRADIDPDAQAALLIGTLRGLAVQRLLDPAAFDLETVCAELKTNLEKALRRKPERERSRRDA